MSKLILSALSGGVLIIFLFSSPSYTSEEKKILLIDTKASCITVAPSCHADMGKKKYTHTIGTDPTRCIICHEVVKEGEHIFKKTPTETRLLCARCHSKEFQPPPEIKGSPPKVIYEDKDIKFHTPFAEGKCTECHDAHESNFHKHLKANYPEEFYASYSADTYALCLNVNCHKGFDKALTEPRTLTDTMFRNGNLNLHFRHVSKPKGRTCKACHDEHGSKSPKLMLNTFEFGKRMLTFTYEKTDTGGTCNTSCHRVAKYDRYVPVFNPIRTTLRPGNDATEEELKLSGERNMQKQKEKTGTKNEEKR